MTPRLSVVICVHDMAREAPRTLLSATTPYQKGVGPDDYEVVVVDNGSPVPFALAPNHGLRPAPRVVRAPEPSPSPARALNWAAREVARGERLLLAIDGARIFSDGLVAAALRALDLLPGALAYTLGAHLGDRPQQENPAHDRAAEDALLARVGWPGDPDALWGASALGGSSRRGPFLPIPESNAFALARAAWEGAGGFDERFASPGGGLVNLEAFGRLTARMPAVCLLSEMTFHQVHGGVTTSGRTRWPEMAAEHLAVTGRPYAPPAYEPLLLGPPRPAARGLLGL